ncbi:exported hydrolase [Caballeronia hypogeia]|uniref:Exported hydrolase n=1 Tax=Caballeronia hypogeia TaxID=1777140 RepID=A0A158BJT5_9BURK|nr:3-hydroxybutyrate oligomer hydrolase family protein [Caballeronia hypogeia]SAK70335.1 exported hydrolase [Caballeronia hypogeia]
MKQFAQTWPTFSTLAALTILGAALAACGSDDDNSSGGGTPSNAVPNFVSGGISSKTYDGVSDDLLTAGLGKSGLASSTVPAISNPAAPTAAELRRLAIYTNYRALVDVSTNGGYGVFWGPNVDLNGGDTLGEGKIAGKEYIAYSDDGSGTQNVTLLVQIPASFNPEQPCIVAAASSASRGVYGAIASAGEWGLKRGCAVAYTDKGTGNGAQEIATSLVTLIDGTLASVNLAGTKAIFKASASASSLTSFNSAFPNRYAYKHAHSQQNPEQNWGKYTLQAIQFAYWALNDMFGPVSGSTQLRFNKGDVTTIAASVGNGGGASLAAAEQDVDGWINAVVVGEPQISLTLPSQVSVRQGGVPVASFGRPLADYATLANLLQPCAALAPAAAGAPNLSTLLPAPTNALRTARCATLAANGLIASGSTTTQASDALNRLHQAGWLSDSDLLQAPMWDSQASPGMAVTFVDAYMKASVLDNLCNFSFGTTNATTGAAGVRPIVSPMSTIFGNGNGMPPTNGINLVYNAGVAGAADHRLATSDASYAGAACLRSLWTDSNPTLTDSVNAVRLSANLRGKPAIIVQGRADALVPVNHSSRPYLGANRVAEGSKSQLALYEITNGQHADGLLGTPGFDSRFIPVQYYNLQALNLMWAHLKSNATLPPSQVVRTVARGGRPGDAPALTSANLPSIAADPGSNAISVAGGTVNVPN